MAVWGWMWSGGAGDLVRIQGSFVKEKYIEILEGHFLPAIRAKIPHGPIRFVQDRSPIHTAKVVRQWFANHPEITLLPWPPKGADLNPIENVWSDMVKLLNGHSINTADKLFDEVLAIWEHFREVRGDYFRTLVHSLPRRLAAVIQAEGKWTKY